MKSEIKKDLFPENWMYSNRILINSCRHKALACETIYRTLSSISSKFTLQIKSIFELMVACAFAFEKSWKIFARFYSGFAILGFSNLVNIDWS